MNVVQRFMIKSLADDDKQDKQDKQDDANQKLPSDISCSLPRISQKHFFIKTLVGLFSGGLLGGDGIFLYVCGEI